MKGVKVSGDPELVKALIWRFCPWCSIGTYVVLPETEEVLTVIGELECL